MLKKMLVLALLVPGVSGCIVAEERGPYNHYRGAVVYPGHVHCIGCGHVYRGGIWIGGN